MPDYNLLSVNFDSKYNQTSADVLVKTGQGVLQAIIVSSHTTGSIKLYDNTSATGAVLVDTYTYASGSQVIPFYGLHFAVGLFADITGTQSITLAYN